MNCANCHGKLLVMGENEELFPGSEFVFCYACRKMITPFLEERNAYPTQVAHLTARRRELELGGVTPSGMSALAAYCAYKDRIAGRRREVAAPPPPTRPEAASTTPPPTSLREIDKLNGRVSALMDRVRLALLLAGIGCAVGVAGLIAALVVLFGG